jgi:integrase
MVRKERNALTWEQVLMLADKMPAHRNVVIVLAQTGMRIGEASGLRWKYVNLTDEWRVVDGEALPPNSILVRSAWTRRQRKDTKNRLWRKIPLASEARVAFTLQWEMTRFRGEDQPVFATRRGTPLDAGNVNNRVLKPRRARSGCRGLAGTTCGIRPRPWPTKPA